MALWIPHPYVTNPVSLPRWLRYWIAEGAYRCIVISKRVCDRFLDRLSQIAWRQIMRAVYDAPPAKTVSAPAEDEEIPF